MPKEKCGLQQAKEKENGDNLLIFHDPHGFTATYPFCHTKLSPLSHPLPLLFSVFLFLPLSLSLSLSFSLFLPLSLYLSLSLLFLLIFSQFFSCIHLFFSFPSLSLSRYITHPFSLFSFLSGSPCICPSSVKIVPYVVAIISRAHRRFFHFEWDKNLGWEMQIILQMQLLQKNLLKMFLSHLFPIIV